MAASRTPRCASSPTIGRQLLYLLARHAGIQPLSNPDSAATRFAEPACSRSAAHQKYGTPLQGSTEWSTQVQVLASCSEYAVILSINSQISGCGRLIYLTRGPCRVQLVSLRSRPHTSRSEDRLLIIRNAADETNTTQVAVVVERRFTAGGYFRLAAEKTAFLTNPSTSKDDDLDTDL